MSNILTRHQCSNNSLSVTCTLSKGTPLLDDQYSKKITFFQDQVNVSVVIEVEEEDGGGGGGVGGGDAAPPAGVPAQEACWFASR